MCDPREPVSVASALVMLDRALDVLAHADAAGLPASTQAEALRALERAEARHTAARARMLTAFSAQAGYEDDGQGSARGWLRWQTRVTKGAAAGAVAWMRRLAAHPVIGKALAAGEVSASWAREICAWSDRLPGHVRDDADAILVAAARGGAEEPDLRRLAEEMYERSRRDSADDEGGDRFDDRALWLASTLGGAGRLGGSGAWLVGLDETRQCVPDLLGPDGQLRHLPRVFLVWLFFIPVTRRARGGARTGGSRRCR